MLELSFGGEAPQPRLLYQVHDEYAASGSASRTPNSNFLRGAKWSPDGACLLTASDDNCLRIFDTPLEAFELAQSPWPSDSASEGGAGADDEAALQQQPAGQRAPAQPPAGSRQEEQQRNGGCAGSPLRRRQGQERGPGSAHAADSMAPALKIQEGELLYDFCWFPGMSAADPASCCLATTGRAAPVHMWDALTGQLRCSYRAYDHMDEVAPAHSLAFSADGSRLYAGFNRAIREFRVERPGRDCKVLMVYKKGEEGLPGIVSCMAPNPDRSGMLAAGSYSGAAALLEGRTGELLCLLEGGHAGGITHMCFSADGNFLYTGARRDAAIRCWDVRYSSGVLYSLERDSGTTNQRLYFDVEPCGRHLATGGEDGMVRVFDLRDGSLAAQFHAADDTVNGVHFHPFLPLLATASGQRRYPLAPADDEDTDDSSASSDSEDEDHSMASSDGSGSERRGDRQGALFPGLSPAENALRVWRCAGRPLELPAAEEAVEGGEEAEAAAEAEEGAAGEPMAAD